VITREKEEEKGGGEKTELLSLSAPLACTTCKWRGGKGRKKTLEGTTKAQQEGKGEKGKKKEGGKRGRLVSTLLFMRKPFPPSWRKREKEGNEKRGAGYKREKGGKKKKETRGTGKREPCCLYLHLLFPNHRQLEWWQ